MRQEGKLSLTRRQLLEMGTLAGTVCLGYETALAESRGGTTVRDRLWLWAHPAGAHNAGWGLPGPSRITPVEAACYMSIPNVVMVRYEGKPEMPFDQYAIPFHPLRQVVWSVVGAAGETQSEERRTVLELAKKNPNFTGVQMDDFFFNEPKHGKIAALSMGELHALREQLKSDSRKLDLWVTLYTYQLDQLIAEYLQLCNNVTLWTWKAEDLDKLEANFEKARKLAPDSRIALGCYMWDYGTHKPMPVDAMRRQTEQGLRWLRDGRISGIIFLASCICDLNLDAVEWTRQWIHTVGNQKLRVSDPA
jgi:hypothetical protein